MSTRTGGVERSGKKRKHEGQGRSSAPAKKSRSGVSIKQEEHSNVNQTEEDAVKLADATPGAHQVGDQEQKSKKEAKREKREQQRDRKAKNELALRKDYQSTLGPSDAVDYGSSDAERDRRRQNQVKKAKQEQLSQQPERMTRKNAHKDETAVARPTQQNAKWTVTEPSAGRFIDHDPVFVRDANGESYLVAAIASELQLLSIQTSLLVRTLPAPAAATVVAFAVESAESNLIHVAFSDNTVVVWDWSNDLPPAILKSAIGTMKALAAVRVHDDDENAAVFQIVHDDQEDLIVVQEYPRHRTKQSLRSLQVLGNAKFIVARGESVVIVGKRKDDDVSYTWMELPLSMNSTCVDARYLPPPPVLRKGHKPQPGLQLAIGDAAGRIHLYDDLAPMLPQGSQEGLPTPRVLHWHRSSVSSVKFSRDGNYLISGGKETVLVLWQLETGRKQFLPHLTSEIERVVVNPHGDRYALQMGDNSIMVLSTSELKPVANFAGLQMLAMKPAISKTAAPVVAAALHPKRPKQLLMTVPPTQPSAGEEAPRPFLQTFDVRTSRHITRQALTRNNVTDFNIGPEDNAILPPDVSRLAISKDGDWLATVDEWMPPAIDVIHLAPDESGIEAERWRRREVYLKVWRWDEKLEIWTLSTRVDAPHARIGDECMGAGRVLALVSDPAKNGFATVGEDSTVKVWKPRTRVRHGVAITDAQNNELIEWTCKSKVELASTAVRADSPLEGFDTRDPQTAMLSYSSDGSLLAVCLPTEGEVPTVTFIDTAVGAIKNSRSSFSDGSALVSMAFLDRHFITVTQHAAYVWDLVSDLLVHKQKLSHTVGPEPLLAVNTMDQTYAIATKGNKTTLEIYEPKQTERSYKQNFDTDVVKILAATGGRGFVLIFADATLRTILPAGTLQGQMLASSREVNLPGWRAQTTSSRELAIEGTDDTSDGDEQFSFLPSAKDGRSGAGRTNGIEGEEDDRQVVRPEQLANLFDVGQSFAMAPVKDMFQAVIGLFGKRPERRVQEVA